MCIGFGGYYVGFLSTSHCLKRYGKYIRLCKKVNVCLAGNTARKNPAVSARGTTGWAAKGVPSVAMYKRSLKATPE